MKISAEIAKQNKQSLLLLKASQTKIFPRKMKAHGLTILVNRDVFPPDHFTGWKFFHRYLHRCKDKKVLEMGCGTGIASLYMAACGAKSVLAVDVNDAAVRNTRQNAKINSLRAVKARRSNLFSSIGNREVFDIIYWNYPFLRKSRSYHYKNVLEMSLFDPGSRFLKLFLKRAKTHLTSDGLVILGWGEYADTETLENLVKQFEYKIIQHASKRLPEMRFDLYVLQLTR